jgi:hypothetical protein
VSEFFNPTQNLLFIETLMSWKAGQFHPRTGIGLSGRVRKELRCIPRMKNDLPINVLTSL